MRDRVPEIFSTYSPGGVGGQHDPFQWVLHRFSHSKLPLISILDIIRQYQKTRGPRVRVPKLFTVFGLGGVGGEHALFRCVLHRFSLSKRLLISILDDIQQYQKTRGMHIHVLELSPVFGPEGIGGQHTLYWCVLHCFSCSEGLLISILDAIWQLQKMRGLCAHIPKLSSVFGPGGIFETLSWLELAPKPKSAYGTSSVRLGSELASTMAPSQFRVGVAATLDATHKSRLVTLRVILVTICHLLPFTASGNTLKSLAPLHRSWRWLYYL